jgi:tetratricopeptide (TPR) repeat protein
MKPFYYTLILLLLGCTENKKTELVKLFNPDKKAISKLALNKKYFNEDSVQEFLKVKRPENQKNARGYFSLAINHYKNEKNLNLANADFISSLQIYPDANTYYEYGNLLSELKLYDSAILAYDFAEMLGFNNAANLMYNTACVYSLKDEDWNALRYLKLAVKAGYSNVEQIQKDNDLINLRKNQEFGPFLSTILAKGDNAEETEFRIFRNQFVTATLPLRVYLVDTAMWEYPSSISYDYEKYITEMRNVERFSREVGLLFGNFRKLPGNENYDAIIYIVFDENSSPMQRYGILATYDKKGKIIDKMTVSGSRSGMPYFMIADFLPGNKFNIINYSIVEDENHIKQGTYKNTIKYFINQFGKISQQPAL